MISRSLLSDDDQNSVSIALVRRPSDHRCRLRTLRMDPIAKFCGGGVVSTKRPSDFAGVFATANNQEGSSRVNLTDLVVAKLGERRRSSNLLPPDQEPVKRKQWLYTDFEWRSKSSANAHHYGCLPETRGHRRSPSKSFSRLLNVRQAVESFK